FGSLEEQTLLLARAFRDRGGLLLPLFLTTAPPQSAAGYREAGLEVACLDLGHFRPSTLGRLLGLVARHRVEAVHWHLCPPLHNPYVWLLSALPPRVRHYLTDHNSRTLPLRRPPRWPLRVAKRLLLRRYAKVLCVSSFVRDCLRRQAVWSNTASCYHF